MADFHVTLNPGVLNDLRRTIIVTFDEPDEAENVEVTIWEADQWVVDGVRIDEGRRNRDDLIAVFRGQIVDGRFQGRVVRTGRAPRNAPRIRLRFDGQDQVHDLPIASRGSEAEGGVYEITASVRGRLHGRPKSYRTQSPVFIQQFVNRRPTVCFVTSSQGGYFRAALAYWPRHCDVMQRHNNLEDILTYVREAPRTRGYGIWGMVNIVSHGNNEEWILNAFRPRRRQARLNRLSLDVLRRIAADQRLQPPPAEAQLDRQSQVVLRGCAIGNNQQVLDQVRTIFGGRAAVLAPKYLQEFDSRVNPPREGFWEQFFISVAARRLPDDARLAELFAQEYPDRLDEREARRMLGGQRRRTRFAVGPVRFTWQGRQDRPTRDDAVVALQETFDRAVANGGITPGPAPLRKGTDWDDFQWTISIQRGRGSFRAVGTGERHEVEIRRPLLDPAGNPVVPDLNNHDHYGRSG